MWIGRGCGMRHREFPKVSRVVLIVYIPDFLNSIISNAQIVPCLGIKPWSPELQNKAVTTSLCSL